MRAIWEYIKREPAILLSLLGAGFVMFASFGIELTKDQTASVTAFIIILLGIITRGAVTPNASVAAKEEKAREEALVAGPAAAVPEGQPVTVIPDGVVETQQDAALPADPLEDPEFDPDDVQAGRHPAIEYRDGA